MEFFENGGIPSCPVCKKPANQHCGGCKRVFYCSRAHQKMDWRDGHKFNCCAFKVQYTEELGRHIIATRDIRAGEMILKEKPALVAPKIVSVPTCLGCHKRLSAKKLDSGKWDFVRCVKCHWPMCSINCQKAERHKQECELMTKRKYISVIAADGNNKKETAYCVIAPLRSLLLKNSNPQQYDNIMSLEGHLEERTNTPIYRILKANLITFIIQVLGLVEFDEETILKAAAIWDTNAFDIKTPDGNFRALYVTFAMMAHDCKPNTKHIVTGDEHHMALIATVPISKGNLISTTYTQTLWGTLTRRDHLSFSKCFNCFCERCKDPTEFGTNLGSIICSVCAGLNGPLDVASTPLIMSTNPLDSSAEWKCDKCNHTLPAKQIVWGNEAMKKELDALVKINPKNLEDFIEKYNKTLHPTNYHILQAKYALTQIYGNATGFGLNDLSDRLLSRKIELCNELLEVAEILDPGLSRFRGILLLDLQSAMMVQTKRDLESQKLTKSGAEGILVECMTMLKEATEILKVEPDMSATLEARMRFLLREIEDNYETNGDTVEENKNENMIQ